MKLTNAELAALPEKCKRDPAIVALYQQHDYLQAYALHTDRRVFTTGYQDAAGADASRNNWDSHGNLQRDFLIMQGLQPNHMLLEIGCGAGRLARKAVPYLAASCYYGLDISGAAVAAARHLAAIEGWGEKHPVFWQVGVDDQPRTHWFDFIWAHSVFTHLPPDLVQSVMRQASNYLAPRGKFLWTYIESTDNTRYGLMQFKNKWEVYEEATHKAGLTLTKIPDWVQLAGYTPGRWSGEQHVALSQHE